MLSDLPAREVIQLFEHLPEVYLFIKDRDGCFQYANPALIQRLGLPDMAAIVGTSDYDRYPVEIADRLARDDAEILRKGTPLIDHMEILYDETGTLDWFSTTKMPLRDRKKAIIGVIGIVRRHGEHRKLAAAHTSVNQVMAWVRERPTELFRVGHLARRVGVSERHLNRQFQQALGLSLQQFLIRSRIQAAAWDIRHKDLSLAEISQAYGFCDQSAFTKQFRAHIGVTPSAYRKAAVG